MKTVAIIQARMQSSRLPGKVLKDIAGKPLLYHVVSRARETRVCDDVLVATSSEPADDPIATYCATEGITFFRGSHTDVLKRYADASMFIGADVIVRFTADCPLIDPSVGRAVIERFHEGEFDYMSNTLKRTYPDGLDTEVFSGGALKKADREATIPAEREHVTPYFFNHPELFRLGSVTQEEDFSKYRWTVDEAPDLEFVRRIFGYFSRKEHFDMTDVMRLMCKHPELFAINADVVANPNPATLSKYAHC